MEDPQRSFVQVLIRGTTDSISVGLGPGIDVGYVEGRVKDYLGVVDGMLSYYEDSFELVSVLEAGQMYYFVRPSAPQGTQAPPPAGEHSSRADARLRQLLSLSLLPLFLDALRTMYM